MTNSISEIKDAECIFVIGSNTTENHPVIALEVKAAVRQKKAKLIVADPRRIELVDFAHLWLQQKPGTDVALINGLLNAIITMDGLTGHSCRNGQKGLRPLLNRSKIIPPNC